MKRIFDILLLIVVSPIIIPIFFLAMTVLWCERSGPIFYLNKRIGRCGKKFQMYKFRTMYSDGDTLLDFSQKAELAATFKVKDDPRVTPVGKWLRKTSLDELPQIINVLKGEMHIVGPRPKLSEEIGLFGDSAEELLSIAPGITGYWQVHRVTARSDKAMCDMELYYVRSRTVLLDIGIILMTPVKMIFMGNE